MGELVPLPRAGNVFPDVRGDARVMRVSCHDESGMVVLSLWADRHCRASFRMHEDDVPKLIETLGGFLRDKPAAPKRFDRPGPTAAPEGDDDACWSVVAESVLGVDERAEAPKRLPPGTGQYGLVVRPISPFMAGEAAREAGELPPAAAG